MADSDRVTVDEGSAPPVTSTTLQPGDVLDGRFVVDRVIGEGGFGLVFQGTQKSTGQKVAIKVLRGDAARSVQRRVARFERETKLQAKLNHPNIVRLIDASTEGRTYIILDFVDGEPLSELLERDGALSPKEAKRLMLQVLDALVCAHEKGVIHRDLKPANIMVTTTGGRRNALVLDFGIASIVESARGTDYSSITEDGSLCGTPAYMAPEQLHDHTSSPASDVYAWGLVFLECLTGHPAIDADNLPAIIFQQVSPQPIPIPAPFNTSPLGALLAHALAKDPTQRIASAREALEALTHIDDLTPDLTHPSDPTPSVIPDALPPRPSRIPLLLAVLTATALLLAIAFALNDRSEPGPPAESDSEASPAPKPPKPEPPPVEAASAAPEPPQPDPPSEPETPPTVLLPGGPSRVGVTEAERSNLDERFPELGFYLGYDLALLSPRDLSREALHVMTREVSWDDWKENTPPGSEVLCGPRPEIERSGDAIHHISPTEAAAFCHNLGMRLPSAEEWEMIVRGIAPDILPGDRPLEPSFTTAGIQNLMGGVSEWVTCTSRHENCLHGFGHRGSSTQLIRDSRGWLTPTLLNPLPSADTCFRDAHIGFRCVRSLPPGEHHP